MNKDELDRLVVTLNANVATLIGTVKTQGEVLEEIRSEMKASQRDHEKRITHLEVLVKVVITVGGILGGLLVFFARVLPTVIGWLGG